MIVRNKIWEELKQADANVRCICWYTNRQRKWARYYKLFIAVVASVGTFGYVFTEVLPFASSLIIAIVSLIKSIFPQILQPERELCELDDLMEFYNKYFVEMEILFHQIDKGIDEDEILKELHDKKTPECEKQSVLNKLIHNISRKKQKEFIEEADKYVKKVYLNDYEESK